MTLTAQMNQLGFWWLGQGHLERPMAQVFQREPVLELLVGPGLMGLEPVQPGGLFPFLVQEQRWGKLLQLSKLSPECKC